MEQRKITAVILAGGASSRIGKNKALMNLGDKTMIEQVIDPLKLIFDEIVIITDTPAIYDFLDGVEFTSDVIKTRNKNSLLGIYSGLTVARNPYIFAIACDMPFINLPLINKMIEQLEDHEDIYIPFIDPHYEPLHALYNKSCLPLMREFIEGGKYKIIDLLQQLKVKLIKKNEVVEFDEFMKCFINVNTYEEYLDVRENFK